MTNTVADIKTPWLNIARRLQAECSSNRGFAVIRISVVVKENTPVLWLSIELDPIEPAGLIKREQDNGVLSLVAAVEKTKKSEPKENKSQHC